MTGAEWLEPSEALDLLKRVGISAARAWCIVEKALVEGRLRCLARSLVTHWEIEPSETRVDTEVPAAIWNDGVPSPGHIFWSSGDANLLHVIPVTEGSAGVGPPELSFSAEPIRMEVRGSRLNAADIDLLAYLETGRDAGRSRVRSLRSQAPLPSDEEILECLLHLHAGGLNRDHLCKAIRHKPGFEGVTNEHARRLFAGKVRRGRRKKLRS